VRSRAGSARFRGQGGRAAARPLADCGGRAVSCSSSRVRPAPLRGRRMDPYRLPTTVVPSRYDLRLEPDLAAATFVGRAEIQLDVRAAVAEIVLNAAELAITDVSLVPSDGPAQ